MNSKHIKIAFFALLLVTSFVAIIPAFAKTNAIYADSTSSKSKIKFEYKGGYEPYFESDFKAFVFKMKSLNADKATSVTKPLAAPSKNLSSVTLELQKPIENVKIYPNPVADQLNLSYSLKKEGLVTIKILDVLGNDVYTLLNQKLPAGMQTNKFMIDSKLNTGFYFVRIISGSDSIVKRISVL